MPGMNFVGAIPGDSKQAQDLAKQQERERIERVRERKTRQDRAANARIRLCGGLSRSEMKELQNANKRPSAPKKHDNYRWNPNADTGNNR